MMIRFGRIKSQTSEVHSCRTMQIKAGVTSSDICCAQPPSADFIHEKILISRSVRHSNHFMLPPHMSACIMKLCTKVSAIQRTILLLELFLIIYISCPYFTDAANTYLKMQLQRKLYNKLNIKAEII